MRVDVWSEMCNLPDKENHTVIERKSDTGSRERENDKSRKNEELT